MTASIDWLNGPLPPSPTPRDESAPIYDEVTGEFPVMLPVEDGTVPSMPPVNERAEFARNSWLWRRLFRRLRLVRWSGTRVTAAAASSVLFVVSRAMWLVTR